MKERSVVWSHNAYNEMNGILDYIARDNLPAAMRVIEKILKAGNNLGKHNTGHPGRMEDIYEKGVSGLPYIVAYSIDPQPHEKETINVLHIIHTARNWTEDKWPD